MPDTSRTYPYAPDERRPPQQAQGERAPQVGLEKLADDLAQAKLSQGLGIEGHSGIAAAAIKSAINIYSAEQVRQQMDARAKSVNEAVNAFRPPYPEPARPEPSLRLHFLRDYENRWVDCKDEPTLNYIARLLRLDSQPNALAEANAAQRAEIERLENALAEAGAMTDSLRTLVEEKDKEIIAGQEAQTKFLAELDRKDRAIRTLARDAQHLEAIVALINKL